MIFSIKLIFVKIKDFMQTYIQQYVKTLSLALQSNAFKQISFLSNSLLEAWRLQKLIFICGNGESAGNAIHLANNFIYGAGVKNGIGLRAEALCANAAVYILSTALLNKLRGDLNTAKDFSLDIIINFIGHIFAYETKDILFNIGTQSNYEKALSL